MPKPLKRVRENYFKSKNMKNNFISIGQPALIELEVKSIEQYTNQRRFVFRNIYHIPDEINLIEKSTPLIVNCNGQYFQQNCIKCGLLLKIWCTEWKACPKCGAKNYGKHYGA